jgi:Fic-DOC domain mobile mystery protein B
MKTKLPWGATPLDKSETDGLIPDIHTQRELNDLEEANIYQAYGWSLNSRRLRRELLTVSGLFLLHQKMFGAVWHWAGKPRLTEKNVGIAPHLIQVQLGQLCDDVAYQRDHKVFPLEELAIRFHHKLTWIHPFPNGNGRHARLATDLFLHYNGQKPFPWSGAALREDTSRRKEYIHALRLADGQSDYSELLLFAQRDKEKGAL